MPADIYYMVAGLFFGIALFLWLLVLPITELYAEEKARKRNAWAILDREFIEYETTSSRRK